MATEVMKSFGTLQQELEQARNSLRNVDENIKRLIGRDPSETQSQRISANQKRLLANRANKTNYENDEPKKRNVEPKRRHFDDNSGGNELKRRHFDDGVAMTPVQTATPWSANMTTQLISKVIVTPAPPPREAPSRQQVLAAQGADEKSKARNRRMFGALLGTLQKFRQEETKLKPKEEKRAQVERKLEEQQIREREELKKERQDLFFNRKRKQAEIRMIELKMTRIKEHAAWEEKHKPLALYIKTKTKPHVYYLPRVLNQQNQQLLDGCRQEVEKMIEEKRDSICEELSAIEQRMTRNFTKQKSTDADKHDEDSVDNAEEADDVLEEPSVPATVADESQTVADLESVTDNANHAEVGSESAQTPVTPPVPETPTVEDEVN